MTLTNDVAVSSPIVNLTSADVTLDTDGRDRSFNFNNSVNIVYKLFKFGVLIPDIMMEGTVSQIFDVCLSYLENDVNFFLQSFPNFDIK